MTARAGQEGRRRAKRAELKVAALVVLREGVEQFTMRKVAKAAGVSKPAMYYYFEDDRDLILSMAEDVLTGEVDFIATMTDGERSTNAAAVALESRVAYYWADPLRYWILHIWAPSRGLSCDLAVTPAAVRRREFRAMLAEYPYGTMAWDLSMGIVINAESEEEALKLKTAAAATIRTLAEAA